MIKKKISSGKRTLKQRGRKTALQMLAACGFLIGAGMMQSCEKDILTGQPSWLGNSIYERLEEGIDINDGSHKTFNYTVQLINDLGYKDILSQTGSKTVFVSSDDDYNEWFKSNSWGVTSYDQLTTSQKKQLFNGIMINNAYLLSLMSNVAAGDNEDTPTEGMCMRRETAATIYDNVPIIKLADFPVNESIADDPVNKAWAQVRSQGKDIHILKDATAAPMIHFLPAFMKMNNITDGDLQIISNGESNSIEDSWINGKKVISEEQTCKNGYIYVISGVPEANQSMAEIVNNNSNTTIWARLLQRFSVPVALSKAEQANFWYLYQDCEAAHDSIYNLRYLNESGNHTLTSTTGDQSDEESQISGVLKFDPGWNQYKADNQQVQMANDAACMFVPTDDVLNEWFVNGGGKDLYERFGSWDNIPSSTIVPLLNVNMLESFTASVPSKFSSVLDDSQRAMGITEADIAHCYMGCNGVVYLTNKVFEPSEFSSVIYPTTILNNSVFSIMNNALQSKYTTTYVTSNGSAKDFKPYLTAMDSRFSLIIPYNVHTSRSAKVTTPVFGYIDPASYGMRQQYYYEFNYTNGKIQATSYPCEVAADGTVNILEGSTASLSTDVIANRLYDLIDNNIIVEDVTSDQQYYLTKSGSVMYAKKDGNNMIFKGGFQLETGESVIVPKENQYAKGNGTTYGVDGDADSDPTHINIPMTATKSVKQLLEQHKAETGDSLFFNLIYSDESDNAIKKTKDGSNWCCAESDGNENISIFDNFNYTVYVPSDNDINTLIEQGALPTWADYNATENEVEKDTIANRIHNFIRYHIQDNSVFVGGAKLSGMQYETAKLNAKTNRFYPLTLTQDGNNLTIKDGYGNERHVVKSGDFYNKCCREYWIKTSDKKTPSTTNVLKSTIESSSNAVVHSIDGVLLYDKSQLTNWRYATRAKGSSFRK